MNRIYRFLRSPRLALTLLVGLTVYAFIGTLVPQEFTSATRAAEWAAEHPSAAYLARMVGLNDAFVSPVFIAAVALLCASTAVCAVARTKSARSAMVSGTLSRSAIEALEHRPGLVIGPISGASPGDANDALTRVADGLSAAGFRVRSGPRLVEGTRRLWGALGSPVFHWALVALLIVVAAGRLTRAEGLLVIPVGDRVVDETAAYDGRVEESRFYGGHTGLEFSAEDIRLNTKIAGILQGPTAVIVLRRDGREVARRRVYPNSPLRYGALLVHRSEQWGYAPLISVETSTGEIVGSTRAHILSTATLPDGVGPARLELSGAGGAVAIVAVEIPYEPAAPDGAKVLSRSVRLTVRKSGETSSTPVVVQQGKTVAFGRDYVLRFAERGYFVTVSVADDWSVPWIYGLFALAGIGVSVALLAPPRRVWVLRVEREGSTYLHVRARHSRGDPNFPGHVARIISDSVGVEAEVE